MSTSILEQLKKKNEPIDFQKVQILLPGQIEITTKIEVKKDTDHDAISFREKLRKRKEVRPVSKLSLLEPEEKETPVKKRAVKKFKRKKSIKLGVKDDKTIKKQKPLPKKIGLVQELSDEAVEIDNMPIMERLPEREATPDITIKGPPYYLANKQVFSKFIDTVFKKYEKELDGKNPVTCESLESQKKSAFSLLIHQKIIKEYMNVYSPYRGLLLYHGLGAGKTCASIAIAEGLKFMKKIIVMTPASLKKNYVEELKICGDPLFRTNQHWEWVPYNKLNPVQLKELSALLSLNVDVGNRGEWTMKKNKGLYLVNTKKKPNYEEMNNNEKQRLNKQLEAQIMYKYQFISYNGLRKSKLLSLETEAYEETGNKNIFNNKVIIIDEAHNFISRIVNKLKSKEKNILSLKLYNYLKEATNCRIVFLTGTPIINYPNEISILFNILRGNIKTFKFAIIQHQSKLTEDMIQGYLKDVGIEDYISYKGVRRGQSNELKITRNPFHFTNNKKQQKIFDINIGIDDELFKKMIMDSLEKKGISIKFSGVEINSVLPDNIDEFKKNFIDSSDSENKGQLINPIKFKRRILGLTSYFRSASERLLPKLGTIREIKIPMSAHQLDIYEKARSSERSEAKRNAKKRMKDVHAETSSSYRIFSRLFCNFVFPDGLTRPMPDKYGSIEDAVNSGNINEDLIDDTNINEQIQKTGSDFDIDDTKKIKKNINDMGISYSDRIDESIDKLKEGIVLEETGKRIMPLKVNGDLKTCSPKFFKLYQLIKENPKGLHLIYSQFRSLEGIELIKTILEENGYAHFDIKKNISGEWKLNISEEDLGKKMFCLYTGKEDEEKKEIIRNIFNSDWKKIDINLATELKKIYDNNFRGEIVQIMMITSSGAEGITLRNVRHVHLIEPYWHPVRTEQVIGRARRICSHQDLPEEERDVSVYLYLMTYSEELMGMLTKDCIQNDKSKIEYGGKKKVLTTDEALWEIAQIKQKTNKSILNAIKESSIDCTVHSKTSGENLKCFKFNTTNFSKWSYIPEWDHPDEDDETFKRNRTETTFKWKKWKNPNDGKEFAVTKNKDKTKPEIIMILYDLDDAKRGITNEMGVIKKVQGKAKVEYKEFEK